MVTHGPLHRSGRAELPHPAPTLGGEAQALKALREMHSALKLGGRALPAAFGQGLRRFYPHIGHADPAAFEQAGRGGKESRVGRHRGKTQSLPEGHGMGRTEQACPHGWNPPLTSSDAALWITVQIEFSVPSGRSAAKYRPSK